MRHFCLCRPLAMLQPIREKGPLSNKSSCENMACASGGAKNMHQPASVGDKFCQFLRQISLLKPEIIQKLRG